MMPQIIDAATIKLEALLKYDDMMVECMLKVEEPASLALYVWSDVLKELDKRGKIRLVSGSYDDIGNALIQRLDDAGS